MLVLTIKNDGSIRIGDQKIKQLSNDPTLDEIRDNNLVNWCL